MISANIASSNVSCIGLDQGRDVGSVGQPRQAQQKRKDKVHGEGVSRLYPMKRLGPASVRKRELSRMKSRKGGMRLFVLEVDK